MASSYLILSHVLANLHRFIKIKSKQDGPEYMGQNLSSSL